MRLTSEDQRRGNAHRQTGRALPSGGGSAPFSARLRIAADSGRRVEACRDSGVDAIPVWLAVLLAVRCLATGSDGARDVRWTCVSGRATYTNAGRAPERIEPLGIQLPAGHTLAVSWAPGETAYTTEVYRRADLCA